MTDSSRTAYRIVIPARMASQRLPGKPLLEINGRSLIEHVYRCACDSAAEEVVIATDSEEILAAASGFGARAQMTSADHQSGSDRIAECVQALGWPDETLVVNLQGDEPLMPAQCLDQAAGLLAQDEQADAASLYWPITDEDEIEDPNVVKVVTAQDGAALYFSRLAIPYPRHWGGYSQAVDSDMHWKRHIGLYAYRAGALQRFCALGPSPLEQEEKLEQLRILESGGRILMAQACQFIPAGVDTREDLHRVEAVLNG